MKNKLEGKNTPFPTFPTGRLESTSRLSLLQMLAFTQVNSLTDAEKKRVRDKELDKSLGEVTQLSWLLLL